MLKRKKKKAGFTLTELLIVIAILAVLASIAVPIVIGIMNKGNEASEDVNAALYTSIMNKYAAEEVADASAYPRLTSVGVDAEYPIFASKAGQGTYPGFNIIAGPTNGGVLAQIRKEAVIAIKAFSDTAVSDDYYINPPTDSDYEYVYYYLTGEVKKMKKDDLTVTSADGYVGGQLNIQDYWVYLSRDGGSGAALGGVSNGTGHLFVQVLQFGTGDPLTGATVTVTSGAKTFTATTRDGQNGFVGFSNIPEGSCTITISYTGAVTFPNSAYYSKSGTIIISPSGYEGCQLNCPFTVSLKLGSLGSIGFYEETVEWTGGAWRSSRERITDSVVVTSDFSINSGKSGGYPRAESYLTNLSQTGGLQELLDGDKFLTYGHYHLTASAYGYRTYRQDVESKIYGLSDYNGNYDGFTSPYEYPIVMRLPTGKGTVSGTIQWESEKQPLYSTPNGLTGTLVTSTNYSIQARVKLTNLSTGTAYYSSYFSTNTSGKYDYSVSNLPDGEYSFEIDSPYGYTDVSSLPETITIDGRTLIVSGSVKQDEASTGKVNGTITYDTSGNKDAIYGATVSMKRLGNSSNSASVTTSATGTFSSGNIKRGFYQITIKLPSTLGGATFYYRMFVGGTHDITLRLAVPTKSITGTVYAYLNSSTAMTKKGTFGDLTVKFTRTNSGGTKKYSTVSATVSTSNVNGTYSVSLVPGYYYVTLASTCYESFTSSIFNQTADGDLNYYLYISTDEDDHDSLSAKKDSTGHWNQCSNCDYKFDFAKHSPSAWTYYSTSSCYKYCTVCSYTTTSPAAHTMTSYVSTAATCTKKGVRTYYCTKGCGRTYNEDISAAGHKGNGVWVYDNNGSSSSVGTHHQNCSVCGTTMNANSKCSRGGYTSNGASNHYDKCSTCGGKRYFDHSWSETSRSGYTCTGGTIYYKCKSCTATKTGSYGATASHNTSARCSTKHSATWTAYCSAGGTHAWNGYYHILCSVCGNISNSSAKWCAMHCGSTKPVIKVNNVPVSVDWSNDGDVWTATHTINGNGDYVVTMTYTDLSTNEMVSYESCKIAIDSDVPVIDVKYTDGTPNQTINGRKYYKTTQTVNVTINEHNFRADDVVLTVTAKDVQGNPVDISSKKYADYAKNRDNWNHNGDVHTLKTDGMVFDIDAIYTFDIVYDDIIDNFAADYAQDDFVVDHAIPKNLKIEYSKSIVDKIIETITFGFYEPEVTVTITADDITSGVDYFDWTYTKEAGTSDKNTDALGARITTADIEYSNNGLSAKATFKVPANARGFITATVTDRSGNSTSKTDKNNITVVIDDIDPKISVEYVADNAETKVQFTDDEFVTVDTFAAADYAYYNGDVTAKIVINEANFFEGVQATDGVIHNVGIKLTKTDDDGNVTVYEYLPTGAVQKYDGATPKYITWTTSGDEHSFNINYADNADYVLEIEYTDLSTNDANISANDGNTATKSYKSKVVTVDKIAPVVVVKYSNEKIIHTIDGRDYFDAEQTATITVKEHNFRADDFVATVVAQDIVKANVNVEDFKATLSDDSKWTKNGNTYTITIKYSVDANYSFDYEYEDLAQNNAAAYDEDIFTVDKTAPKNLTVSYSQSVADKILETITFGYYNAKVTVTITAEDDTAGIHRFEYAYLKSEGVSSVNAELLKAAIEEAAFTVEGNKSTATFEIPKDVLKSENQFNGTVKFVAFDRSENNTEKADTRRVIVDNIAPTATITYNEPVQKANDISYYAGNIDAKIVINEANFYSEDVVVKVNDKDVAVKWGDDSVDVHTGTFTLTEDGDYIVTVEYKDRSANEMTKYTSNRLTLDTKAPTVNVTNIKINSANKDEKYGFTITANDINLDATSFKPVLTATIRNEDGSYGTKTVPLGEMKTVEAGKTYTFTVDNLTDDAVYSLVCTLKDMSGNAYSKVALSDGKEYEEVRFSINRNGSTFTVDKNTDTLVNQYYVYSVDEDVIIEEVNVDPVETYVVKLNGETLTEGTDYTSTLSDKAGEWSKRTYVISKELFKSEGEYSIVVESTDKADTTAYSDVKNLNVSFVVDQTAPVLTISGLENGGRYQVEEQTVTVIPTDDGGRLYSIKVIVLNSDGEPLKDANGKDISVRFEMSGEEFLTYLTENNGKIKFTVPEGLENQVQIICNDCAVNADGKTNEYNETYTKVTVSQSGWIIFYANKPLFYGSIAGVLLLVGGIIFLIFLKKRKKESK